MDRRPTDATTDRGGRYPAYSSCHCGDSCPLAPQSVRSVSAPGPPPPAARRPRPLFVDHRFSTLHRPCRHCAWVGGGGGGAATTSRHRRRPRHQCVRCRALGRTFLPPVLHAHVTVPRRLQPAAARRRRRRPPPPPPAAPPPPPPPPHAATLEAHAPSTSCSGSRARSSPPPRLTPTRTCAPAWSGNT